MAHLTLTDAIKEGRLDDFVLQAEQDGVGPALKEDFARAMTAIVRNAQSDDQTSGSPRRDGLPGK